MRIVAISALLAACVTFVSPIITHADIIQIKGLNSGMSLDQALQAIREEGGACTAKRMDGFVYHSCRMHSSSSFNDRDADVSLQSQNTGAALALRSISFSCDLTNTCGMTSYEIAEALLSASILSQDMRVEELSDGAFTDLIFRGSSGERVQVSSAITLADRWSISIWPARSLNHSPSFN